MAATAGNTTVPTLATHDGQGALPLQETLETPPIRETELQKSRKAEVLAMIRFPWQKLGYEIAFLDPKPGYRAMTIPDKCRIEIYMRPGESALPQAYDLAHELGHAFDLKYNNPERRRLWLRLRGIDPSTPWFSCSRCADYGTPAGDFAETFALLLLGPGYYHSWIAQPPAPKQIPALTAFCQAEILGADGLQASTETRTRLTGVRRPGVVLGRSKRPPV